MGQKIWVHMFVDRLHRPCWRFRTLQVRLNLLSSSAVTWYTYCGLITAGLEMN